MANLQFHLNLDLRFIVNLNDRALCNLVRFNGNVVEEKDAQQVRDAIRAEMDRGLEVYTVCFPHENIKYAHCNYVTKEGLCQGHGNIKDMDPYIEHPGIRLKYLSELKDEDLMCAITTSMEEDAPLDDGEIASFKYAIANDLKRGMESWVLCSVHGVLDDHHCNSISGKGRCRGHRA